MASQFDKIQVANSFGCAANSYDQANFLQRDVGDRLFGLLDSDQELRTIIDVGCGTGIFSEKLAKSFSSASVLGIDIAEPMIHHSISNFGKTKNLKFLCADADQLPVADKFSEMVFSNLMLQWSPNVAITLKEWHRVLVSNGKLFFSTLGQDSLRELYDVWSKIDDYPRVSNFITKEKLLKILNNCGFSNTEIDVRTHVRSFDSIHGLMQEIKMLGAHNLHQDRSRGLLGKGKFAKLQMYYETYRDHSQKLLLSFEVYYVNVIK